MASITSIQSTDLITDSRANINDNFANLNADKMETSVLDTDTTLAANSDSKVATQKAVKAYVDAGGNVNATETTKGIVEIATDAEVAAGTATGATGANLVVTPDKLATRLSSVATPQVVPFTASGTWTKDDGLKYVVVEVIGGGGGGEGDNSNETGAGCEGGYSRKLIAAVDLGATETVTVGGGGAGSNSSGLGETAGSTSSFGSHLQATGGGIAGGVGGVGSGGDINGTGVTGPYGYIGGKFGRYGAGGPGGSTSNAGTAGVSGIVIVTEYYE